MNKKLRMSVFSSMSKVFILALLACTSFSTKAYAHGDLDERILAATLLIKQWPDSAALYVNRATLYYQHEEYKKAITDISQSQALGSEDSSALIILSKSARGLNQYDEALKTINAFIDIEGEHVIALRIKARVLMDKGEYSQAADYFSAVIAKATRTLPENYLESAKAYSQAGKVKSAIAVLQQGIDELGNVHGLHQALIDLHVDNGDFDSALGIQEKIIEASKRKERPFYQAALICMKANKTAQAKQYLDKAAVELSNLPNRIRLNRAMQQLEKNIAEANTTLQ